MCIYKLSMFSESHVKYFLWSQVRPLEKKKKKKKKKETAIQSNFPPMLQRKDRYSNYKEST